MLYNWAVEHAHDVGCIAGIYPVTNIESWPNLGGERIQQAYGMSEAELRKHLRKNNPIDRLAPLAQANVSIFHIHGDADKVVSLQQNTLEFARRYNALGGKVDVEGELRRDDLVGVDREDPAVRREGGRRVLLPAEAEA